MSVVAQRKVSEVGKRPCGEAEKASTVQLVASSFTYFFLYLPGNNSSAITSHPLSPPIHYLSTQFPFPNLKQCFVATTTAAMSGQVSHLVPCQLADASCY